MTTINRDSKPAIRQRRAAAWRQALGRVSRIRLVAGFAALGLAAACAADLDRNGHYDDFLVSDTPGQGGATGSGGGPSQIPPDPSCVADVFANGNYGCSTVCHSSSSAASVGGGLDLSGSNLGQRLSTTHSKCSGQTFIIDPATPSNSMLLKMVTNTATGCPMYKSMPPGTNGLSGADLTCIQNWITSFKP